VPVSRPMWCVQAGTALSSRVRHGTANSVNLLHWDGAGPDARRSCGVERCDYNAGQGRFETALRHELALAPG